MNKSVNENKLLIFVYCVQVVDKVRTKSSSGRAESPSLSVYATLRTQRSSPAAAAASPLSTSTSTSTPTSSRLYSPSLSAGLRAFPASSSSPRTAAGTATRDGPGKRPSAFDQRKSPTLETNGPGIGKHATSLNSSLFQSSGHDVDF